MIGRSKFESLNSMLEGVLKRFDKRVEWRAYRQEFDDKFLYLFCAEGIWCKREYEFDLIHGDLEEFAKKLIEDVDWIRRAYNTVLGMKDAGVM